MDCWLDEIIGRYTDASIKAEMEHFQNQFIRHDEVIDILKHDVRKHESQLVKYAQVKITIGCNRLKSKF